MHLRLAAPADIPLLERWDSHDHVAAATGMDTREDWAAELAHNGPVQNYFMAEHEGRVIGTVQIIDPALEVTHYWGDCEPNLRAIDIWIGEACDLGKGLGTQMMTLAIERCFAPPDVTAIIIDPLLSNVDAQRFYRRFGFVDVGERRFDWDDCLVMRLERAVWEARRV